MAHYSTLQDYHFSADADDIRGAQLHSLDNQKIGKIKDVILDHQTGEIRYLVVDTGRDRKVLIASDHLYRSIADEEDFETDISAAEVDRLPRFDENLLRDEEKWSEHEADHHKAWKEQEERLLAEYKEKWHEAPVQHRHGSDRNVTPEDSPESGSSAEVGERIVTGADLTPRRIAGKFPGVTPMFVPGNPNADQTALHSTRDEGEEEPRFGSAPPSPRWHAFQQNIRQNLDDIRAHCITCRRPSRSRVA